MTEPGQIREFLYRDFIGDFETKLKIRRHLGSQSFEIFLRWERVIRCVNADRLEHLGIFFQAITLKPCLGNLASVLVTRWRVKLAEPAVIFPTRCANEHALCGKHLRFSLDLITVEGHVEGCRRYGAKSTRGTTANNFTTLNRCGQRITSNRAHPPP